MSIKKNFFAPWASGLGATRRAAMLLLVMMLTMAQTAWADNINVATAAGFGTLTDGKYTLVNGNTYTLTGNINTVGYIYVPAGVTATIDLNGHAIDRGLTSEMTNGSVIIVEGTLTITDASTGGKIQGGYDAGDGYGYYTSCVKVLEGATFNLQGGTLIGRVQDYDYTVSVVENSNFTMTGGKITGGRTGVLAVGNVTLTGGEISGNNIGVRVGKNFSISGNPVITGNTVMNADLSYSGGIRKINITGALTDGANIGITVPTPTDNSPVTVTSGYNTYNSVSPDTYFSLDNNGQIQTSPFDYMTVVMGWNEDRTEVAVGTALYTVNFDMNGHGDAIDAVSLLSGYKVAEPTEPTADDWFFVDWFTDDAYTAQWNFDNTVTSNMTLHARWTQEAIYSIILPENMVIVSTTNALVGGKYPVGTEIKFKLSSEDYVVDGDVKNGDDVLTTDGDGNYTVTMGDADLTITAMVKKAVEPNKTLSGSESYTAQDGDVLTGSTSGTVTIANNAKITLSDVTITGGIVCAGTAEITLVGTNSVTGASQKAGIQVGGSGTTLTIKGNGSLTANGGAQSAGIGLSRAWKPANDVIGGDIVIEGGNITANGGSQWGAGIGTGVIYGNGSAKTARIGNITIKGGSVKATGGSEANGIGTGYTYGGCTNAIGTVTIYDGIDKVDASSIKNSGSIVYKHEENDVTASKSDYFTIIENGNRRIIVQKVTPTIADVPDQTYTGSAITPEPTVIAGSLSLTKGTDYVYSYTNNTNVGTAKVRATFQGDYASLGSVEKEFTILPSTVIVNVTGNGTVTYNDKSAASGETFGVAAEKGTDVTLTLAPESGYAVSIAYGYTNNSGTTASGLKLPINGTTATLTVPNDLKDGTYVNLTVTFVSALAGGADEASAVALTDATVTDLGGGWYKVDSDISFDHTLNLLGDTHLIIADGKTMTVNTASNRGIYSDYTLFVSGEGTLSVATTDIAVCVGNYVQTGATVTASGSYGIRCTDDFIAFNVTNDFTFSGGQLTATGSGGNGIWADNDITLSCTNATDFIQASSYSSAFGAVKIAEGKALTDGTEASNGMNGYSGTLTNEQRTAIGGKTLHRAVITSYVDATGTLHENVIAIPLDNTMTTLAAGWYVVNENVDYTGKITLGGDVNIILADGKTMSVTNTGTGNEDFAIYGDSGSLHIYGQSQGTGALTATANSSVAIKVDDYITINGGTVNANGIYAEGDITINGGTVKPNLRTCQRRITINGGKVTNNSDPGIRSNNGTIILGLSNATDYITAESYSGAVKVADGQTLVDDGGNIWSGTLSNDDLQNSLLNKTLRPVMGVVLTKDGSGNISAEFDGTSLETVSIPVNITVNSVTLNRTFTYNKCATLMLPFSLGDGQSLNGGTLYKFDGVNNGEGDWVATLSEFTSPLKANTPYLIEPNGHMTDDKITFDLNGGTVTLNTTTAGEDSNEKDDLWDFIGTYSYIKWTTVTGDQDYSAEREAEIGKVYGFAAVEKTGIHVGDFVRVASGAKIRPMCAYLKWKGSIPNNARALTRAATNDDTELPQRITVKLVSASGETTAIGTLDTTTGEVSFDSEAWYTLDGVRLSGKPTKKGLYINNGKKIVIK